MFNMTVLLDGERVAERIKDRIKKSIKSLDLSPSLAAILIGENPSSEKYLELKDKDCSEVGIDFQNFKLSSGTAMDRVINLIDELNRDGRFDGILVQLPTPDHLDENRIIESIKPEKDVDGLHPYNMGKLWTSDCVFSDGLIPCAPKGVIQLLDNYDINMKGKEVVVINDSKLVGRPLAKLMLDRYATVTICHIKTENLMCHTEKADILITAVGKRPEFVITGDMVKEESVVVDVGVNYVKGKLLGDVSFEEVKGKASYITPVPGGVGPMTRAMLLENVLIARK